MRYFNNTWEYPNLLVKYLYCRENQIPNITFPFFIFCAKLKFLSKRSACKNYIQTENKHIIIAGDFNVKNKKWGGKVTTQRGMEISELVDGNNLICLNDGKMPTLVQSHTSTSS